jgi:hypothetical protein
MFLGQKARFEQYEDGERGQQSASEDENKISAVAGVRNDYAGPSVVIVIGANGNCCTTSLRCCGVIDSRIAKSASSER